jgi:hypothetical protein
VTVAHRYGADYLILEQDHVASLDPLYRGESTYPALQLQHTIVDDGGLLIQVYAVRR